MHTRTLFWRQSEISTTFSSIATLWKVRQVWRTSVNLSYWVRSCLSRELGADSQTEGEVR